MNMYEIQNIKNKGYTYKFYTCEYSLLYSLMNTAVFFSQEP